MDIPLAPTVEEWQVIAADYGTLSTEVWQDDTGRR